MTTSALSDVQALTTLAFVLERLGLTVDPYAQAEEEAHLREALAQPEIVDHVPPDPAATRGDLARTALTYLADRYEATRPIIERASTIPARPHDDLARLGIGALVLLALRGDIDLAHEPGKGWRFRFRGKDRTDPTIRTLLRQLPAALGQTLHRNSTTSPSAGLPMTDHAIDRL